MLQHADTVCGRKPLTELPDEKKGRELGKEKFGQSDWGPEDALT